MSTLSRSRLGSSLAYFLCLWGLAGSALPAVATGAPTVTTSLKVNGAAAACGAMVSSGNQVCVLLSSNQDGFAVVTIKKGTGTASKLASGSVKAGVVYRVCVTAGTGDGITRTFAVSVTNAGGQTTTQYCTYIVKDTSGQNAPNITTSLKVNGVAKACGVTVGAGNQVCLLLSSNQDGNAVVTIRKGNGAAFVLASGTVKAGVTYSICVTAGAADNITRTFKVTVKNAAGISNSEECTYKVY